MKSRRQRGTECRAKETVAQKSQDGQEQEHAEHGRLKHRPQNVLVRHAGLQVPGIIDTEHPDRGKAKQTGMNSNEQGQKAEAH